jgi:hypothetical protein
MDHPPPDRRALTVHLGVMQSFYDKEPVVSNGLPFRRQHLADDASYRIDSQKCMTTRHRALMRLNRKELS